MDQERDVVNRSTAVDRRTFSPDTARTGDGLRFSVPSPRTDPLRRQRLIDFLYENIDHPLQLVCAPAGYGKTTLLADFAHDAELKVCWYTVDEVDSDPRSFIGNLSEAIRSRFPSLQGPGSPTSSDLIGWQAALTGLVTWIGERVPEYFILIVDDFHEISRNPAINEALDLLLQRLPDNCRLIISSREIPQLASLPKLISERKVAGVGAMELRFTPDEIRDLLKVNFELDVTLEEAHRLHDESEGWITSILLTTHSLWKGLLREVLVDRGRNTLLFEYIATEVFAQQPVETRRFLLTTSVCNKFDAELANVLVDSDGAGAILEEIESKNLFMTRLGGTHPWYQYHHLFRDYLREKMSRDDPTRFLLLNARAAEYFQALGDLRQAIYYYIQGSEFERALEILEGLAEPLSHEGLWDTLGNWIERIPEEHRSKRPGLMLYFARVQQLRGRNDDAIRLLNDSIGRFREEGDRLQEAKALMRRSYSLRNKGAYQMAIRDARAGLALAREAGSMIDQADGHSALGTAFGQQGKFGRAETELKAASNKYQQQGSLYQLSEVNDRLGTVYNETGDFSKAAHHFEQARQGWQKLGNQRELSVTLNNMAFLNYQQAQLEDAESLARESVNLAQSAACPREQAYALMTLADAQRERGEYSDALSSCQQSLSLARQLMETHLVGYGSVALGETYRLMGESDRARTVLNESLASAVEAGQEYERGLAQTSLGVIEYEDRSYEKAEATLKEASEALATSGQRWALARARLHLAQALFLSKKYPEALEQMDLIAQLCAELGQTGFLAHQARDMQMLVQYASSRGKARDFFAHLAQQLNSEAPATEEAVEQIVAQSQPPKNPQVDVATLGGLQISLDGVAVLNNAWGSAKAREMFLLMLYKALPLHKEKIVEWLWPDISASKANSNFHSTLYRVHRALYPSCVERDGELYQLNRTWTYRWDALEFEQHINEAKTLPEDSPERDRLLEAAVDLYRGPFLEELDAEWCDEVRTDLEFKFLKAVNSAAERQAAAGELQQSIDLMERALAVDELQEEMYYNIIKLYLDQGDRASAARVYRRCVSVFGESPPLSGARQIKDLLAQLN